MQHVSYKDSGNLFITRELIEEFRPVVSACCDEKAKSNEQFKEQLEIPLTNLHKDLFLSSHIEHLLEPFASVFLHHDYEKENILTNNFNKSFCNSYRSVLQHPTSLRENCAGIQRLIRAHLLMWPGALVRLESANGAEVWIVQGISCCAISDSFQKRQSVVRDEDEFVRRYILPLFWFTVISPDGEKKRSDVSVFEIGNSTCSPEEWDVFQTTLRAARLPTEVLLQGELTGEDFKARDRESLQLIQHKLKAARTAVALRHCVPRALKKIDLPAPSKPPTLPRYTALKALRLAHLEASLVDCNHNFTCCPRRATRLMWLIRTVLIPHLSEMLNKIRLLRNQASRRTAAGSHELIRMRNMIIQLHEDIEKTKKNIVEERAYLKEIEFKCSQSIAKEKLAKFDMLREKIVKAAEQERLNTVVIRLLRSKLLLEENAKPIEIINTLKQTKFIPL